MHHLLRTILLVCIAFLQFLYFFIPSLPTFILFLFSERLYLCPVEFLGRHMTATHEPKRWKGRDSEIPEIRLPAEHNRSPAQYSIGEREREEYSRVYFRQYNLLRALASPRHFFLPDFQIFLKFGRAPLRSDQRFARLITILVNTTQKTRTHPRIECKSNPRCLFVVSFTMPFLQIRLYSVEWKGDKWMMNWIGFERSGRPIPAFAWRDWGKPWKTSVRKVGLRAEIWIR
jgi:hypothetical protein